VVQLMRIEYVCSTFFLVDIVVCFATSPRRRRYATSLITVVNFLSLIPTAVTAVIEEIDPQRCFYRFWVSQPSLIALFRQPLLRLLEIRGIA